MIRSDVVRTVLGAAAQCLRRPETTHESFKIRFKTSDAATQFAERLGRSDLKKDARIFVALSDVSKTDVLRMIDLVSDDVFVDSVFVVLFDMPTSMSATIEAMEAMDEKNVVYSLGGRQCFCFGVRFDYA
jgi:hypothetical protein